MEIEPLAMYSSDAAFEKAGLSEGDLPKTWDQTLAVAVIAAIPTVVVFVAGQRRLDDAMKTTGLK